MWLSSILGPESHEDLRKVRRTLEYRVDQRLTLGRIVKEPIQFPRGMPPDAQELITGLCNRDRTKRYGNVSGGSARLKTHPFFKVVDWDAVFFKKTRGPIIPRLSHAADTSHFDEYEPESEDRDEYTDELQKYYEEAFQDF
jgi:protein kinase A